MGGSTGTTCPRTQLDQRERYAFMPPLDPAALGRGALCRGALDAGAVRAERPVRSAASCSAVVERRQGDEVLGYYAAWLGRAVAP